MGYTTRDTHIHKGDNGEKNTSVQLDIVIRRRVIVQQGARDRYRDNDDDVFGADHFGSDSAVVGGPICRGRDGRGSDTRGTGQPDVVEPGPGCAALYPGGPSVCIWVWVHHHDHAVVPRWTTWVCRSPCKAAVLHGHWRDGWIVPPVCCGGPRAGRDGGSQVVRVGSCQRDLPGAVARVLVVGLAHDGPHCVLLGDHVVCGAHQHRRRQLGHDPLWLAHGGKQPARERDHNLAPLCLWLPRRDLPLDRSLVPGLWRIRRDPRLCLRHHPLRNVCLCLLWPHTALPVPPSLHLVQLQQGRKDLPHPLSRRKVHPRLADLRWLSL